MALNYFDLIVGSIVLLLGLKGILNGFFKEVFGLIGIVGGVFVASRFAKEVGEYLSNLVFKFDNDSAIGFTGFLVTLAVFWGVMVALGVVFKKLSKASGLGIFDKILGFVFGASKFFLIVSIIAYAVYNVKTIRVNLKSTMESSFMFPVMVEVGGFIMKMDPVDSVAKLQEKQDEMQEKLEGAVEEHLQSSVEEKAQEISEAVKEKKEQLKEDVTHALKGDASSSEEP